ncbi:MAG: CehA/McbA family metallohydrolase [Planctomycetaceae bacterium]|nr:CehA/McbA family metallohydrolase [Planctomycetales bacterium]MCB9925122.1 CehA/McbA family metallohydrolase [Planctomycetaceae bacterium]
MSLSAKRLQFLPLTLLFVLWTSANSLGAALEGEVTVAATDKDSGGAIAVRMHLKDARGRPVMPRGTIAWKDHFVFDGKILLSLRPGAYTFEIERGPEYRVRTGHFTIERGAEDSHVVQMERFVDMKREGWWCGDLHVHRPIRDIELLMRAEDLHIAPIITWWNQKNDWAEAELPESPLVPFDGNRFYHLMGGEDEREGGALMYFNLDRPLPIQDANHEYPSPLKFLEMAREHASAHVDIEKPFWWDMPTWVASGKIDSIGLANNHMCRSEVLGNEAWGKPRDAKFYPGTHGNGHWTQDIYYHLLNCGLRIPPSAGSASGVLPNPVGYNRVYVYCEGELTYDKWFEGLRAGRVVVTNGPMLRPRVNGELPGHVFTAAAGETIDLQATLNLSIREKVEYLEIVKNGRVEREVRLSEYKEAGGKLPKVSFAKSGWMLIRAVTNNQDTFRFASSGPYYIDIGQTPRISKTSAQFFFDWVYERARRIKIDDAEQREAVIKHHRNARDFWQALVERATAE